MNIRAVAKYLSLFTWVIGALMLPSLLWALYFGEWEVLRAFLYAMAISGVIGGWLALLSRNTPNYISQREALGLVSIAWFLVAGIGALPYLLSGQLGVVDAYFESMSGFTTTGSTILVDIEAFPKSLLFWRSMTQWLGGMGIVVLFIAVLPYLGAGGKQLFKSESPGPDPKGLSPRIKDTASILYKIYLGLTVAETLALKLAGLSFYDSLCHTLSTLATGGFSTKQLSVAGLDGPTVEIIIIFFMLCAGTNFALFFAMLRGDRTALFKNAEWRVYIGIIVVATALITLNLMSAAEGGGMGATQALRQSAFQVVSIMTTTGFCTADFNTWPHFSKMLLVMLMFVGGCAGSTGGGMKVMRFMILAKMLYWRLEHTFRTKTIRAVRINDDVVERDIQQTLYAFFVLYIACFVFGCLFMSAVGLDFVTASTSVIATLNNIGPGLESVGATGDFAAIPVAGKVFLTLCMALGRLELFSVLVLFIPSFWRHS